MNEQKSLQIVPGGEELYRCRALTAQGRRCKNAGVVLTVPDVRAVEGEPIPASPYAGHDNRVFFDGEPFVLCPAHFHVYRRGVPFVVAPNPFPPVVEVFGGPFDGLRLPADGVVGPIVQWPVGALFANADPVLETAEGHTRDVHIYHLTPTGQLEHLAVG